MDFIFYYVAIGFVLNLGLALLNLYRGQGEGYMLLPHAMYFFLTIFSWPKTLWDLIAVLTGRDKDEG